MAEASRAKPLLIGATTKAEALFARFDNAVREAGYIPMSGQIVEPRAVRVRMDASRCRTAERA